MDNLNLPIIDKPLPEGRHLSMDEYAEFVSQHIKYTLDLELYKKQKKQLAVYEPFKLI